VKLKAVEPQLVIDGGVTRGINITYPSHVHKAFRNEYLFCEIVEMNRKRHISSEEIEYIFDVEEGRK